MIAILCPVHLLSAFASFQSSISIYPNGLDAAKYRDIFIRLHCPKRPLTQRGNDVAQWTSSFEGLDDNDQYGLSVGTFQNHTTFSARSRLEYNDIRCGRSLQ